MFRMARHLVAFWGRGTYSVQLVAATKLLEYDLWYKK